MRADVTAAVSATPAPGAGVNRVAAPSLKQLAIRGSLWTIGGYGASQALRLASNIVLTRLLFPEAFGLMALVLVVIQGLEMFSDMGIGPSVIHNPRGDDPAFLNTAWTLQVMRGAALWLCGCILAWPVAWFYGQPALVQLIPVAALSSLISGLNSTSLATCNRHLALGRFTVLELGSQGISIAVMVVVAYFYRTVWALPLGSLVGSAAKAAMSHVVLPGVRNRLHWDRDAAHSLLTFGRWIFISTALTFLMSGGDRIVLGRCMSQAELGVYAVAYYMSHSVVQLLQTVSSRVLFPLYSRLRGRGDYYRRVRHVRMLLLGACVPLVCLLVLGARLLIDVLYDQRYQEAGWMLQVLLVGAIPSVVSLTMSPSVLAAGDSFSYMLLLLARSMVTLGAIALGAWIAGATGVICGLAAAPFLGYVPIAWAVRRQGLWMPMMDAVCAAAAGGTGLLAWMIWK